MMQRARRTPFLCLASLIAIPVVLLASGTAMGDEWLDRLNEQAAPAPGEQNGTKVLFDAVAGMDEPPDVLDSFEVAREVIPGMSGWAELAAWAGAPAQQKVIEAVATLTERKDRYILGLPYSDTEAPSEWKDGGLFITLPEDGLLVSAGMAYLARMDGVFALHWVEMVRLVDAGEVPGAIDVMERTVRLARIMMERPTSHEVSFATDKMIKSFEKILDTCRSFTGEFSASDFADLNRRFEERRLLLDRQELPMGDKQMAGQLVARGIEERRSADGVRLAKLMSGLSGDANQRPLERFSRAAHWKAIAEQHADWFDVTDELDDLFGDWKARWALPDLKDPMLKRLTDYEKMDKRRFLILEEPLNGYERVFDERMMMYTSAFGTRNAIAALGFFARSDRFPPELPAVQPQFIKKLEVDPYSIMGVYKDTKREDIPFTRWQKHEMFEYFVPIRDQTFDRREEPGPYEVLVQLKGGASSAEVGVIDPEMYAIGAQIFSGEIGEIRRKLAEANIPSDAFNADVGGYNLDKLRPFLIDWVNTYEPTSDEARAFQLLFDMFKNAPGFSTDRVRNDTDREGLLADIKQGIRDSIVASGVSEDLLSDDEGWVAAYGITFDESLDVIAMTSRALITAERTLAVWDKVLDGGSVTRADVSEIYIGMVEGTMTEEFMSPFMDIAVKLNKSPVGEAIFSGHEVAAESFKVHLDDTTFILYSVGPDEVDNDAKNVYPPGIENKRAGTDVLIYPPALSLKREQGGF